ncbi:hypothetical protein [uncultured Ramlibacter sp.]|uniref:hypothetical protein n=1 Tax=uncultured Ramlibacter sp. TaxID=260755 RepID=UPI00260591AE|nr:hypothetical protein [uncultured Ramlibacter sp.]
MTFRIDTFWLDGAGPGRWICWFKGFRGQGVYGKAQLDDSRSNLVIASTMDPREREVVPVVAAPVVASPDELHAWIAEQLEALGWGPAVDQSNKLIQTRAF